MPLFEVRGLTHFFGGLKAVSDFNVAFEGGELMGLIGPNGAGKTTIFNLVCGVYRPSHGEVKIQGQNLVGLYPHQVTAKGVARTFQNIRIFPDMTVLENVMIGRHCRTNSGVLGAILRDKDTMAEEKAIVARSYEILKKIGLTGHVNLLARNLPYGAQRRLEIARALATDPFLLLLDEPAAGMNPQETKDLEALIISIRDEWEISVFLIEHDMKLVMGLSDSVYVMDYGEMIARGTPQEIRQNPEVIKAYLGEDVSA